MADQLEKRIHVQFFATLREQRGAAEETVTTCASTPAQLYSELRQRYNFTLAREIVQVAINDEFQDWDAQLQEKDKVVFIPPVAGG